MFGLNYVTQLPAIVRDEFVQLVEGLKGFVLTQHNDDGSHGNITAANVVGTGYGTFAGQYRLFCKASALTLADSTETAVAWETPVDDGYSLTPPSYDLGWNYGKILDPTQPTILLAPVDGLYLITYSIRFAAAANGSRYVFLSTYRNGNAPSDLGQNIQPGDAAASTSCQTTILLPLKTGWGFRLQAQQSSGGNLAIQTGFLNSWLQVTKVG